MGDHPKYIIVEDEGHEQAIVFAPILSHKQIAGAMKVVAAGFCSLNGVSCWGKSVTLGIKSRSTDADIISKQLLELY